ncbi:hypothetical protein C8F01DRAFT_1156399 [Mycena amicta]|nr:hypothetical protein C8F01DRAFT_1156399 [Mycena amicta]
MDTALFGLVRNLPESTGITIQLQTVHLRTQTGLGVYRSRALADSPSSTLSRSHPTRLPTVQHNILFLRSATARCIERCLLFIMFHRALCSSLSSSSQEPHTSAVAAAAGNPWLEPGNLNLNPRAPSKHLVPHMQARRRPASGQALALPLQLYSPSPQRTTNRLLFDSETLQTFTAPTMCCTSCTLLRATRRLGARTATTLLGLHPDS